MAKPARNTPERTLKYLFLVSVGECEWPLHVSNSEYKKIYIYPQVFYTYFYCINTPVVPPGMLHIFLLYKRTLINCYTYSFLEAPTGFFNHFWIQVAISLLKPPHGGFRSETAVT
jgi:hypothetical protein